MVSIRSKALLVKTLLVALALAGTVSLARADMILPPGVVQDALARQIRGAGYDCARVASNSTYSGPEARDMMWGDQAPDLAVCANGKKYLVAKAPRRPSSPPVTPPAIRVKPL